MALLLRCPRFVVACQVSFRPFVRAQHTPSGAKRKSFISVTDKLGRSQRVPRIRLKHKTKVKEALKKHFDDVSLRPGQQEILSTLLRRRDACVVLPTGYGKSLCYQIPPLVSGKPTVVVSPLISLMQDQVSMLKKRGIRAEYTGQGMANALESWDNLQLIYMSPESASQERTLSRLEDLERNVGIGLVAIDEAHCVSDWGQGFRPDYRELHVLRRLTKAPMVALTATATEEVIRDIFNSLSLDPRAYIYRLPFNRPNLFYSVVSAKASGHSQVRRICMREAKLSRPTVVYCSTVKECEKVFHYLESKPSLEGKVGIYHGQCSAKKRSMTQQQFMDNKILILVSTIAFGMGVDKPDIRHIIHVGFCKSVADYYQQTGRAGRDGKPSNCTLIARPWNIGSTMSFLNQRVTSLRARESMRQLNQFLDYIFVPPDKCRRAQLLSALGPHKASEKGCGMCDNCINKKKAVATLNPDDDEMLASIRLLFSLISSQQSGSKGFRLASLFDTLRGRKSHKHYLTKRMMSNYDPSYAKSHWRDLLLSLAFSGYLRFRLSAAPFQHLSSLTVYTNEEYSPNKRAYKMKVDTYLPHYVDELNLPPSTAHEMEASVICQTAHERRRGKQRARAHARWKRMIRELREKDEEIRRLKAEVDSLKVQDIGFLKKGYFNTPDNSMARHDEPARSTQHELLLPSYPVSLLTSRATMA